MASGTNDDACSSHAGTSATPNCLQLACGVQRVRILYSMCLVSSMMGRGSNSSDTSSNNGRRVRRAANRRMRHRGPCQPVAAEPLRRRHRPRCCTRCRKRPSNRLAGTLISRARRDPSGLVCSNITQSDQSLALRVRCTVLRLSCVMIPESCLNPEGWAATNGGRSGEVPSSFIHIWGATFKQYTVAPPSLSHHTTTNPSIAPPPPTLQLCRAVRTWACL